MERDYSPSEIRMLEIEIRDLREKVIKLEQEKFLLTEQVTTLKDLIKSNG